jgi:hypothetical protein
MIREIAAEFSAMGSKNADISLETADLLLKCAKQEITEQSL